MQEKFAQRYVAHYGIRTKNLQPMIGWYTKFFDAHVQHDLGFGVFMTWDEDHHRLVLWSDEETTEKPPTAAGVDHIGIGLPGFSALVESYERLKDRGIEPDLCVNHLFSTSFYYHDPDGNEVELTVDNLPSKDECSAFMKSEGMQDLQPPFFGYKFEAAEMADMVHAGAAQTDLAKIGVG
jgi:catechol-2,3-dioxygenase